MRYNHQKKPQTKEISDEFLLKARKERWVLNKYFNSLDRENNYIYSTVTPEDGKDSYDGTLVIHSKSDNKSTRFILEVKIREVHYPELLLEKKKCKQLLKKANEFEADVLYITTTPKATYIFNITKLEDKLKWVKQYHWQSTVDKTYGKILKDVTFLNTLDGSDHSEHLNIFNITTDDIEIQQKEEEKEIENQKPRQGFQL